MLLCVGRLSPCLQVPAAALRAMLSDTLAFMASLTSSLGYRMGTASTMTTCLTVGGSCGGGA